MGQRAPLRLGDPLKESELDLFFRLVDKNGDGGALQVESS
jgi:hypothetical protein